MSDKDKNLSEEEYQFPSDEYIEEDTADAGHADSESPYTEAEQNAETVAPPRKPNLVERFPILRNKRMIGIVVVAVLLIIGFDVYHSLSSDKTKILQKATVTAPPKVTKPQFAEPNPQVVSQISQLRQTASQDESTINQLQNKMQTLRTALHSSNQATTELNQSVQALVEQMRHVTKLVQQEKNQSNKKHKAKLPSAPPVVYHLKAVLPGRAWIIGSNGISDTVRVGQKLKNYGTVESINPSRGLVLTSSGKVIGYGTDDS